MVVIRISLLSFPTFKERNEPSSWIGMPRYLSLSVLERGKCSGARVGLVSYFTIQCLSFCFFFGFQMMHTLKRLVGNCSIASLRSCFGTFLSVLLINLFFLGFRLLLLKLLWLLLHVVFSSGGAQSGPEKRHGTCVHVVGIGAFLLFLYQIRSWAVGLGRELAFFLHWTRL